MKGPLTEGNTKSNAKRQPDNGLSPIAPPPAGNRAPVTHYGTDRKASELAERGFVLEGYIMRDEHGDAALLHCGRVVWLTSDELDEVLAPNSNFKVQFSDEEEG